MYLDMARFEDFTKLDVNRIHKWTFENVFFDFNKLLWAGVEPGLQVEKPLFTDDYAGDTSTTGVVVVDGDVVTGSIEEAGDDDWFAIEISDTNQHYYFRFKNLTSKENMTFRILDGDGNLITTHSGYWRSVTRGFSAYTPGTF